MLDLDDASPEVAEQHRAEGSGENPGEVENQPASGPFAVQSIAGQSLAGLQPRGPGRK